jgi:hypothetical protein
MDTEDFWADLLSHIRDRVLVPVAGPDLNVVNVDGKEQLLTSVIGRRIADRYGLTVSPGSTTIGEAVAAFLQKRGQDDGERLYRVINDLILELDPAPSDALRNLAAIDDMNLFVATTPDRLMAKAVNEVRFGGRPETRELAFSPSQSTAEQSRNAQPAAPSDTVVLNLFGQAASTPQYAIHDEDRLEWLHALLSDAASLPEWLAYPLKHQPMLFIGCELPDWFGRFLLRMSSESRLSLERNQFYFVNNPTAKEPALSAFFQTYCRRSLVQQLDMEPTAFVAELRARWERQNAARLVRAGGVGSSAVVGIGARSQPVSEPGTIFISYMREDAEQVRRLCDAITSLGGDVWLDERRICPGDAWEQEVLSRIRRSVRLFVPVISANTERSDEGYVFREWNEAIKRSLSIMGRRFIVPVVIDSDYAGDASGYRQIPAEFRPLHFGSAPGGSPDQVLLDMLTAEIRAMRRTEAA